MITLAENQLGIKDEVASAAEMAFQEIKTLNSNAPVIGITGTGGAGKSSLTDELISSIFE